MGSGCSFWLDRWYGICVLCATYELGGNKPGERGGIVHGMAWVQLQAV